MKFGEGKQSADRIERRQRRPRPGQDHDDIGQCQGWKHPQCGTHRKIRAGPRPIAPGQVNDDSENKIDGQQQSKAAHAKRGAGEKTEGCNIPSTRRRQCARDADEKQRRSHHRGGERNVLGVVEHGAIPGAAQRQGHRRDQARARSRDQSCGRGAGGYPANPRHRAEDMTQIVGIEGRTEASATAMMSNRPP